MAMVVGQEQQPVNRVKREVESLAREFEGRFAAETIQRCAEESLVVLQRRAAVREFIPLLVYKSTRERLRFAVGDAMQRRDGQVDLLFVCVRNAGRSQMAAAFATALGQGRIRARSAGSDPADRLDPNVIEAMGELGFDLSAEAPSQLTDEAIQEASVVVTMGCGDACPVISGRHYFDWPLPDPAGQSIEAVRAIRDEIRARVESLLVII